MGEDAGQLARVTEQFPIQDDAAPADERCRVDFQARTGAGLQPPPRYP
jgi:hypothetical protein